MSSFEWNIKTNVCKNPLIVKSLDKKPFKIKLLVAEFEGKWDCAYQCFLTNSGAGRWPWKSCCDHASKNEAIENAVKEVLDFIAEQEKYYDERYPVWLKDELKNWIPSKQLTLF